MTAPLPAIPVEASTRDQSLDAFLVEKSNRSGPKRTTESHSRMLWRFFADTTPDRVTPAVVLCTPTASDCPAERHPQSPSPPTSPA